MEPRRKVILDRNGRTLAALALAGGGIVITLLVCNTVIRVKGDQRDYSLEVYGGARRTVQAAHMEWRGQIEAHVVNVAEGHAALERVRGGMRGFLVAAGIPADDIRFPAPAVNERTEFDPKSKRTLHEGYDMVQWLIVKTQAREALLAAAGRTTELLSAAGITGSEYVWKPGDPHYIYLSFDEVKQAVLAEATSNARVRAQTMAKAAGVSLGRLRQVAFGDIEIRSPASSTRYSDDESSPQKDVIANVKLLYLLK